MAAKLIKLELHEMFSSDSICLHVNSDCEEYIAVTNLSGKSFLRYSIQTFREFEFVNFQLFND